MRGNIFGRQRGIKSLVFVSFGETHSTGAGRDG